MNSASQNVPSATWTRVAEVFGALLFVSYAVLLLAHSAAPSLTDYANWVYQGVLLHGHLVGVADAAHRLKSYPVPNSAATLGVGLLCFLLPWKWAADVWLCLQLGASWWVTRRMLCILASESAFLWAIVPVAIYLNVNFWYGFVNFQLGLCWVVLLATFLLVAVRDGSLRRPWRVGLLLVACFFTHMIPFCFSCLLLLLYARQTRRWRVLRQGLPAILLTGWYVAGRFLLEHDADGQAGMVGTVRTYSGAFWLYKANSYVKSFGLVNPLGRDIDLLGKAGFGGLFVLNLLLCGLLGWAMMWTARQTFLHKTPDRFLWLAVLAVLPLYLLLPGAALGVSDPGSRLLQTALALAVLLCGAAQTWVLRAAALCSVVLALVGVGLFALEGFNPVPGPSAGAGLFLHYNHVPNDDQDYFYRALQEGTLTLPVFPTGMFLNR